MLLIGLMMWSFFKVFPALTLNWTYSAVAAVVMVLLGLVISLGGVVTFKGANTTMDPKHPDQASTLISSGIYRYSRNPMYLGVLFMLVGWGFYLANLLSILCVLIFVGYITRFQIIPEERLLQEKFGSEFLSYKRRVRRWL